MSSIRTVLGDIAPDQLGLCYAHEHIIIDPSYATQLFPEFRLDSVESGAEELTRFYQAGGRAMIDSMPCASGRNVLKLAEISRRSGVHIVCPTGYHLKKYYPQGHWGAHASVDTLVDLFSADITEGIDKNDYAGPVCARTTHRAGIIKVAGGLDALDEHEKRLFEAAAHTHACTGAPILTHTEKGTAGLEQVAIFEKHGVDPRHVVLSHTDRKPDHAYHRELLATGVNLEYDAAFRWPQSEGNPTRDLVIAMAEAGSLGQIMLGMDAARRAYWRSYGGGPGLNYLLTTFSSELTHAGLTPSQLHQIFVDNPKRAFAMQSG